MWHCGGRQKRCQSPQSGYLLSPTGARNLIVTSSCPAHQARHQDPLVAIEMVCATTGYNCLIRPSETPRRLSHRRSADVFEAQPIVAPLRAAFDVAVAHIRRARTSRLIVAGKHGYQLEWVFMRDDREPWCTGRDNDISSLRLNRTSGDFQLAVSRPAVAGRSGCTSSETAVSSRVTIVGLTHRPQAKRTQRCCRSSRRAALMHVPARRRVGQSAHSPC